MTVLENENNILEYSTSSSPSKLMTSSTNRKSMTSLEIGILDIGGQNILCRHEENHTRQFILTLDTR